MKKFFGIVLALTFIAACAAPPTNKEVATNRNSETESAPPVITEADAIAKEKAVWDAIKNKNYEAFSDMLASDQLEVLDDGVHDKPASVEGVKQFEPSEVNFSDWKFLSIDNDAFVVTYTVAVKGKLQGKDFPFPTARASSAWVNRAGKWLAIYHQECLAKPAMTPPASKADKAKAESSPMATSAAPPATGPDPIANEKIVWDLFKTKNYDAFAELVAPNQVEVEPDGVYDKAGTIKGVAMFDASKAVLSDFKAVNLDDDAALVTYTVKNPSPAFAPEGERHSTIWVKREGKWLAVFHHGGTSVRKPAPAPKASPSPKTSATPAAKTP